ncbi:MAG: PepSY domain-containing protein, partial [Bacteroidales bacterium]|nr:PepSY domain-containing protein [Bacteroidales bacterium]
MSAKKFFRTLHLWLSVPFGIFITLICFSGAMMVYEKEINELCRHDLYFVKDVKSAPLPMDSLMAVVSSALPDSVSVSGVTISPDPERAWQVSLSKPRRASVYVDQYTGEIKGRSERLPFFNTMFHMHRWMLGSSKGAGKQIVGISTLVLVVILLTGLLMWLTNRNKPLSKSLTISFCKGWPRFWHDLHVAGGIYVTVFLLALALTGLTWSFSWYRNGFYKVLGVETSAGGSNGVQVQQVESQPKRPDNGG